MNKSLFFRNTCVTAVLIAFLASCVITRPITINDQRKTVSDGASWVYSIVPGLTQLRNREYAKAAILASAPVASMTLYGVTQNYSALGFAQLVYIYQYADGVYSSHKLNDQRIDIVKAGQYEKQRDREMESLSHYRFTASELEGIRNGRRFWIGMPVEALYVSLGKPDRENRTVLKSGVSIQHVYKDGKVLIYSDDGIVTSWQD